MTGATQTDVAKYKKLVAGIDFFAPFTDDELDIILAHSAIVRFNEGEFITREAAQQYTFYVILQGHAEVLKDKDDMSKKRIAILKRDACFGEIAILLNSPRTATVKAATQLFAFKINGELMENIPYKLQAKLYKQFASILATRLQRAFGG